ncbi:MAG TPA: sigma-70 family RNA polymerase sigma factor [Candidatus Angelobacter sp.]|jgi:RNA polymerase sigma-70 factor (ECF subfamily)|nr:sigma-70 family RNA polymerase sigma factor [Candidatus Angelobacter sp.]
MASATLGVDDTLVLRAQSGDPQAVADLVAATRPMLQRFARRFFPDPARAEDMAQTALMKAFARMGDLRSPEAFQTWLLRIARNECLNELTRQRVAQIPMSTLEDQGTALEAPAGGADDPEEMLVRTQMQDLVRRVTATLPEHYRQTLTMRALEDRSYEEISEALDIPVTVARLWYCRARKRFRTAFIQTLVARRDVSDECQEMGSLIAEMIEGTLNRHRRDVVHAHLADCAACRQTEDELRNTAFRAPARLTLLALGLARLPMHLRRSLAAAGSRGQQLAGEIALGAGATVVLVTGSGLGGFGGASTIAHAATAPAALALVAPAAAAPSALVATPRVDAVHDWSHGSPQAPQPSVVAMPPAATTAVDLVPSAPDPSQTQLPFNPPPQPSLRDAGHKVQKTVPSPSTAMLSNVPGMAAVGVTVPQIPAALTLLSQ